MTRSPNSGGCSVRASAATTAGLDRHNDATVRAVPPVTDLSVPGPSSTKPTPRSGGGSAAYLHEEMAANPWEMYAFDPAERPNMGARSREWTAIGNREVKAVREMARCLREIAAGRVPK